MTNIRQEHYSTSDTKGFIALTCIMRTRVPKLMDYPLGARARCVVRFGSAQLGISNCISFVLDCPTKKQRIQLTRQTSSRKSNHSTVGALVFFVTLDHNYRNAVWPPSCTETWYSTYSYSVYSARKGPNRQELCLLKRHLLSG